MPGPPPRPPPPPRLGRSAMAAGAANFIGRISGLIREMVFARVFGAGAVADAFNVAYRVPNLLRELLAEGSLANVFVPIFAEEAEGHDPREGLRRAWALANAFLGLLLLVLGGVTLLFIVGSELFVYLLASGFSKDPEKAALAADLTEWMAPFLAGLSVASLFGGMLNVRGKFFLPALAPSFLNFFVIAACLLGEPWEAATGLPHIHAIALAATLSGFATATVQYPALRAMGFRFRPNLRGHPEIRRILKFMGASLIGIGVVQFNLLVETQLASTYQEADGPVSWLIYGFRLVQLPQTIVAGSVAVAALAALSLQLGRGEKDQARITLGRSLELNSLLIFPSAVGLYLLADPLIRLFFEGNQFTAADTAATAGILRSYAVAAIGICTYRVLLPVFFALKDPYLPMRLSLVVVVIKLPLAWGMMYPLGLGLDGLPLSHAVTASFEVLVMMWVLGRRMEGWARGFWSQQLRIALATTGMGLAVYGLTPLITTEWALLCEQLGWGGMSDLGVLWICAVGAGIYGVLAIGLGVRETRTIVRKILRRGPPPPPGGLPPGAPEKPPPFPPPGLT
jgi:putative peptidoglycan lipid II flippase